MLAALPETHAHVAIVGPVGVGKTFLAHALGAAACRRGYSVLAHPCDRMLKALRHARLDATHEAELRKLLSVDLLILDDFGLDAMDATESCDIYELFTERHRRGSIVVTSNRGPDEWLATFADPVRAQAAVDRFTSNAYDLVIDGESYRARQKPALSRSSKTGSRRAACSTIALVTQMDPRGGMVVRNRGPMLVRADIGPPAPWPRPGPPLIMDATGAPG